MIFPSHFYAERVPQRAQEGQQARVPDYNFGHTRELCLNVDGEIENDTLVLLVVYRNGDVPAGRERLPAG